MNDDSRSRGSWSCWRKLSHRSRRRNPRCHRLQFNEVSWSGCFFFSVQVEVEGNYTRIIKLWDVQTKYNDCRMLAVCLNNFDSCMTLFLFCEANVFVSIVCCWVVALVLGASISNHSAQVKDPLKALHALLEEKGGEKRAKKDSESCCLCQDQKLEVKVFFFWRA